MTNAYQNLHTPLNNWNKESGSPLLDLSCRLPVADLHSKILDMCPTPRSHRGTWSNFLHFHAVVRKMLPNNNKLVPSPLEFPPSREILDLPPITYCEKLDWLVWLVKGTTLCPTLAILSTIWLLIGLCNCDFSCVSGCDGDRLQSGGVRRIVNRRHSRLRTRLELLHEYVTVNLNATQTRKQSSRMLTDCRSSLHSGIGSRIYPLDTLPPNTLPPGYPTP